MSISLNDIPQEILLEILTFVDAQSLIHSCPLVCRLWKNTIDGSTELRLLIELWADGMVGGDSRSSTAMERLEALYQRRRAWLSLDWADRATFVVESSSRAYELVDAIFAQQTVGRDSESFSTIWLPSARDPEGKTVSMGEIDLDPRDFVLDPTQDFVAFVSENPQDVAHVQCRTLSTLSPHPLAAASLLSFPARHLTVGYLLLDLADDIISMFFDQHILLLNWRDGVVIKDINCSGPSRVHFSLLTPRAYLLGYGGANGKIEVWSFESVDGAEPIHKATLQLPELDSNYLAMQMHSGPFRAKPSTKRPFSKTNESRVCVVSVDYGDLIVHHRYLHKYLSSNSDAAVIVPWDDWGPRHSRLLPPMLHRWFRYVHGERVVLPPDPENPNILQILDFSTSATTSRPLASSERTPTDPRFTTELYSGPSTLFDTALVEKSATTSLPYRKISRYTDEEHALFLIDEEQIIGVNDLESQMTVYTF
ncbi:hypothetical protein MSAN_02115200 [Mycena sanguinolenta]|uniref:F-box domain-containing protein n=1 Tax=Mycena sanguinolenta TaxID=230812 RepID=A0A8H7CM04_9AGAR|nr:hypothetical protein MSAN_02115200 [Mycena sanguinolenta]